MREVVLAGVVRTAVGSFGGTLRDTPAVDLGALVIKEAIKRAGIAPDQVDEVLMGCVIQAGLGQNVARLATLKAGLPHTVPAQTINIVCGSGLNSVNMAALAVASGQVDVMVAGGMENMSMGPYAITKARYGYRMGAGTLMDTMINDALTDVLLNIHMGVTAENVAEKYGITREQQDEFAAWSQNKAEAAIKGGKFKEQIVPVEIKVKKDIVPFDTDEFPRAGVTAESLKGLPTAFKKDGGTVTPGNASGINDGAAAMVVMCAKKAKELGVKPMARWIGGALGGVDPAIMGIGPVDATNKLFKRTGLTMADMDIVEANEAFAAQALAVGKLLEIPNEKLNPNGGAIAIGHPVGASGTRILTTLLYELKLQGKKKGLATLCVGGGQGVSMIVENLA